MHTQTQINTSLMTSGRSLWFHPFQLAPKATSSFPGVLPAVSTASSWEPVRIEYSSRILRRGFKFGDFRIDKEVIVGLERNPNSVVSTLLEVGIAESGEDEHDALQNLLYFVTGILEDMRDDPQKQLSPRLARQVDGLRDIFTYEPSDH